MFDPGGVLHAALREALRRSHACFARGVVPRHFDLVYPGEKGTISSSPAPPSEWLGMQSISARVPKPGSVQSTPNCVSLVNLFVHLLKSQSAGCACDRKQSFLTPEKHQLITRVGLALGSCPS
jgi:hypothetical protein